MNNSWSLPTIITILMLSVFFTSCKKDDEFQDNQSPSLEFIQVRVYSEDITAPNGNVYLFYVEDYLNMMDNTTPVTILEWTPFINYTYNRETRYMTPVSEYGTKYKGDLLVNEEKGYSVHSFFWSDLSTLYGKPKPGGKYVLLVVLRNGVYLKAYNELTFSKNSIVEVHFPKSSDKDNPVWANAEFIIRDYVSDY